MADRLEDARAGPVAAGQHEPDDRVVGGRRGRRRAAGRRAARRPDQPPGDRGHDRILAVPGGDHQRPTPDPLEQVVRLHGPDQDMLDDDLERRPAHEHLTLQLLGQHRQGRVGEERSVGQDPEEADTVVRQPPPDDRRQVGLRVEIDLVDHGADDLHALFLEERRVEDDLVDRPADAALADDQRPRAEHPRHRRVGEADDGADAGMAGPFDDEHLAAGGDLRVRLADPARQVGRHPSLDVGPGEAARDVHRAHLVELVGQIEGRLHQDGVLVGRRPVDDRVALADRLDEAGPVAARHDRGEKTERDRRLAAVHAGGGEVELAHRRCRHRARGVADGGRSPTPARAGSSCAR